MTSLSHNSCALVLFREKHLGVQDPTRWASCQPYNGDPLAQSHQLALELSCPLWGSLVCAHGVHTGFVKSYTRTRLSSCSLTLVSHFNLRKMPVAALQTDLLTHSWKHTAQDSMPRGRGGIVRYWSSHWDLDDLKVWSARMRCLPSLFAGRVPITLILPDISCYLLASRVMQKEDTDHQHVCIPFLSGCVCPCHQYPEATSLL